MILDFNANIKFIRTLAQSRGLNLVFTHDNQPRTDGKTIYVPTPDLTWSEEEYVGWQFYVFHELGHNVPAMRDCFEWIQTRKISMASRYGFLMNLLDDYRQEYYKYDEYEAKEKIMSKGRAIHTKPQFENITNSPDKTSEVIHSLWMFDLNCREDWMFDLVGLSDGNANSLSSNTRRYYDTLTSSSKYRDGLNACNTSYELEEFIDMVLMEVYDEDPEEWKEEGRKEFSEKQSGQGEGEENAKAKGKGSAGSENSTKKGGKDDKDPQPVGGIAKYEDLLAHSHDGKGYTVLLDGHGLTIDYSTYKGRDSYYPSERPTLIEIFNRPDQYKKAAVLNGVNSNALASKVRKILQIKSQSYYEGSKKKGKLHPKNFHKIVSPDKDRKEQIHRQKVVNNILDVSVTVLVDTSGSMSGNKYTHACQSALCLNESISKIGVPLEIIGFTSHGKTVVHYLYKKFTDRLSNDTFAQYLTDKTIDMSSNADGESILFAYERLTKQKSKRKILIVLSDGQPAGGNGDIYTYTKDVIKQIETDKKVEIYGVGIQSDAVKNLYKECQVIKNSAELENSILTLIKSKIIG